jgi:hypothetical protein
MADEQDLHSPKNQAKNETQKTANSHEFPLSNVSNESRETRKTTLDPLLSRMKRIDGILAKRYRQKTGE